MGKVTMVKIGFTSSNDVVSRVIRWFTKGRVSHTFIYLELDFLKEPLVMEANWDGYHIKPYSQVVNEKHQVTLIEPAHPTHGLIAACIDWLGKPYDYSGLLGAAVPMIGRWFKLKLKNPTQVPQALFCSEAIAIGLQKIKYPGAEHLDASSTTPEDLLQFLQAQKA